VKRLRPSLLLLFVVLSGCATRSSLTEMPAAPDALAESDVIRLVSVWEERLCRHIADEGRGDEEVLATLRQLHSRNVLRPARITFGVLDVDADPPERHGWDVQGVLVGMERRSAFIRYVFVVGIVGYTGYVPTKIQDIRLVTLSPQSGTLVWEMSPADPGAVTRYRQTFGGRGASRFPADDDNFRMVASRDRASVHEVRSGADWSLENRTGEPVRAPVAYPGPSAAADARRGCG
jgi:hypothetical protein